MIPRAEDHNAKIPDKDRSEIVELEYTSSMMDKIRVSSIVGEKSTKRAITSDLFIAGMNWSKESSSIKNGKKESTIKKEACAAYTGISSLVYFFKSFLYSK